MKKAFNAVSQYMEYRKVFTSHRDIQTFRHLRNNIRNLEAGGEVATESISVKDAGNQRLLCRKGTMDAVTLWDAYYFKYHLPHVPVECNNWIVSLGANAGYTTANMGHLYPNAKILAVEMDEGNAEICRKNTAFLGDRVQVVNASIWHEDGVVEYDPAGDVHAFSVHNSVDSNSTTKRLVPALCLSTLFDKYSVDTVDFLKMDIEGAEFDIFNKSLDWAEKVSAANIEIHPPATSEVIMASLKKAGFECGPHPVHKQGIYAFRVPTAVTR